jgi:hypothetical protein
MTQLTSFMKQIVATIQGDDAKVVAQQIFRSADAAFKTQIASLKGDTITLEDNLLTAQENLASARINHGTKIENRNDYISKLVIAQNAVLNAETELKEHEDKIAFLESQHKLINE